MSPKLALKKITKTQMSPKCICHQQANFTKTHKSPKHKKKIEINRHQNSNITNVQMLPQGKCHKNKNGVKMQMSQKCKCRQNFLLIFYVSIHRTEK